jgi:hypothetical protein
MIDAFAIGVSLQLNDAITGQLAGVASQFEQLQQQIDGLNASLKTVGGSVAGMAKASSSMAASWKAAAAAAQQMAAAAAGMRMPAAPSLPGDGGGGAMPPAGGGWSGMVLPPGGNTPNSPGYYPAEPSSLVPLPGQGPAGYQGWGWSGNNGYSPPGEPPRPAGTAMIAAPPGGGGGGDGPPNFTMPNGAPDQPFNAAGPVSLGPNKPGGVDLFSAYYGIKLGADIASATFKAPFDAAATVDQKIGIMKNAGISASDANAAYQAAVNMEGQKQYSTLSVNDLLTILAGNLAQTHNLSETESMMPTLANAATVLSGMGVGDAASQIVALTRAGDLSGMFNQKNADGSVNTAPFQNFVKTFMSVEQAAGPLGDSISPEQILLLYQNMGVAGQTLSPEGQANAMIMALTLGQLKAGTGFGQVFKEMVGGKMPEGVEDQLSKAGLITTKGAVRHGQYVTLAPDALKDESLLLSDPVQWFATVFAPQLEKMNPGDRAALIGDIYKTTSTQQGARVALDAVFNAPTIKRLLDYSLSVPDLQTAATNLINTPAGTAAGAKNASNALLVTLSNDTMSVLLPALGIYRVAVNKITQQAQQNPEATGFAVLDTSVLVGLKVLKEIGAYAAKWMPGARVVGAAAGTGLEIATGPVGETILVAQIVTAVAKQLANALTNAGLDGSDVAGGGVPPGHSPQKPLYIKSVDKPAAPGPTMPSGPTTPPASTSLPNPGKPLPR